MKTLVLIFVSLLYCDLGLAACKVFDDKIDVRMEIAGLMLERQNAAGDQAAAMKTILTENIEIKLAEYLKTFGEELDTEELQALVRRIEKDGLKKAREAIRTENKRREAEDNKVAVIKSFWKKKIGAMHDLSDLYLTDTGSDGIITGSGVQWSKDEKYVLVRPYDNSAAVLIEMPATKKLTLGVSTGMLSDTHPIFASNPKKDVAVFYDLSQSRRIGPFVGNPEENKFNERFAILVREVKSQKSFGSTDRFYSVADLKKGKVFDLGKDYAHSADFSRVAIYRDSKTIDVIDSATQKVLRSYAVLPKQYYLVAAPDGTFTYKKPSDKKLYMVKLDDFSEYPLPDGEDLICLSPDGKKVYTRTSKGYVLRDLKTGTPRVMKDLDETSYSKDKNFVIFHKNGKNNSVLVDFLADAEYELDGPYDHVSDDGAWVYYETPAGGPYRYHLLHVATNTKVEFVSSYGMTLLPDNFALTIDPKTKKTYYNLTFDLGLSATQFEVGVDKIEASPSGKYIISMADNETVQIWSKPEK